MSTSRLFLSYFLLIVSLIVLVLLSLSEGSIHIPLNKVWFLLQHADSSMEATLLHLVRMPRTGCAVIVGATLALTGVMLFYISHNDLGCPSLLGIHQGVFFGILLCVVVSQGIITQHLFMSGLLGGIGVGLITFLMSFKIGFSPLKLILIGQAINLFFYSGCQLLLLLAPEQASLLLINLNGSLANSHWELLKTLGVLLIVMMFFTLFLIKKNYLLSFSTEIAKNLGVNVTFYLYLFLGMILIMSTCAVMMVGPLLFFPLLVLQTSRLIVPSHLPYHFAMMNALIGSLLLVASDLCIRGLFPNWEAPLNIFIALLGVPLLILRARNMR